MTDVAEALKKLPEKLPDKLPEEAIVFAGDVMGFGPPPPAWSGRFPMYQAVKFVGVTPLRGEVPKVIEVEVAVRPRDSGRVALPATQHQFRGGNRQRLSAD